MIDQLSFFDIEEAPKSPITEPKNEEVTDWCLVYLVTRSGGNQGNLFILHQDDAIKLCEDKCSHGQARQGQWMFMWTSLEHFRKDDAGAKQHKNVHGELEPFVFKFDTGKQDKDFERLGIKKPDIWEMENILNDLGYKMKYENSRDKLKECGMTDEDFKAGDEMLRKRGIKI